jgi:hypothetical protein
MKRISLILLVLALCAGCEQPGQTTDTNPFAGAWIGHGEVTQTDTPSAGHTTIFSIDDVITFRADKTFALDQVVHQFVDGLLTLSAFQRGGGAYSYTAGDAGILTMDFDASSDPGLTDGTPSFTFSADHRACTIQPPTVPFPLEFQKM